jgi:hypothetical protein
MRAKSAKKAMAVGVRCSVYYSCGCALAVLFIWLSPRSALGMSDDEFVGVLSAAYDSAMILSILNALLAIGIMVRFPRARRSPWLWAAIASPVFVILVTPGFQSA